MSLKWLTPDVKNTLLHDFANTGEISDNYSYYSPSISESLNKFESDKALENDVHIISKEKRLQGETVDYILRRLNYDKFNIYDLAETDGFSSLPFIKEILLDEDRLNKYTAVTTNRSLNNFAIRNLRNYTQVETPLGERRDFKLESIVCDLEMRDFRQDAADVRDENTTGVYLLLGSRLGNSINPEGLLRHTYNSMRPGEHAVILQRLYRENTENTLISDYSNVLGNAVLGIQEIAPLLTPESSTFVDWDERINGVKIGVRSHVESSFEGIDIKKGQEITFFRSTSFPEDELRKMLRRVGFTLVHITYDSYMDHGLFLVQKV